MKKIIVAIDASESAAHAAGIAAEMAVGCGAHLLLTHTIQPIVLTSQWMAARQPEIEAAENRESDTLLKRLGHSLKESYPTLHVETRAVRGNSSEAVASLAADEDADLVVVGSRSHGLLGRLFLGSFASRLVHTCTRPVLVTR